ncbi:hypothetical protein ALP26_102653 [Pseudomonas savastanoi pv. glycinea]|uniref:Uncharacterized protein n=1 Tax=Pseudomonas savastanoi pv. glycinea TaxID=318 RepID=A0A3M3UYN4_PSESG|nr:Unknown protein sequence [Pseudomonas savastanoi pv. glycinea]RMO10986.1 hypothetical protein ALQ46_101865 [Pseudomonas savastanoi pv. phaseolicola]KPC31605.1 Unknown protein sequence [Pseudomonas savastanoi pv. glycinea]KPC38331.1 Unknown protein sequence [Pseudomonas savastanoi pv. glycinea]KPC52432.1 Unknown protein sequence [Pseudomonas savastanoi pv. glycinea]
MGIATARLKLRIRINIKPKNFPTIGQKPERCGFADTTTGTSHHGNIHFIDIHYRLLC